jgi:hypothetical protein
MTAIVKQYKGRRGVRSTIPWEPKKWKPRYDMMVALWSTGRYTQRDIAKLTKVSHVMVGLLLRSDMAKPYIEAAKVKMTQVASETQEERIQQTQERAFVIIEKVMHNDELVETNPFSMMDRSIKFLEATGKIKGKNTEGNGNGNINVHGPAVFLPIEHAERIGEGLSKLNEIKRLHAGS